MKNIFLIIFFFLFACKKEKKDEAQPQPQTSERFRLLTENHWVMTHEYVDSTSYAKNHLTEWPLNTTDDFMDPYDTCALESDNIFLPDGQWKLKKNKTCSAATSEDVGKWKLFNSDNDFIIVSQDTMHIVELNKQNFKMYYEVYTYYQGKVILVEYDMWTFKAR